MHSLHSSKTNPKPKAYWKTLPFNRGRSRDRSCLAWVAVLVLQQGLERAWDRSD